MSAPPEPSPRPRRAPAGRQGARRARRTLLALLAALSAGCGDDPRAGHDDAARYRVVLREFAWSADPPAAPRPPLSLVWTAGAAAAPGAWRPAGSATDSPPADGSPAPLLALRGRGQLDLLGPGPGIVQPELQHWLTFRARTTTATSVSVHWRNRGEEFSTDRRTSEMALDSSGGFADYQIPLSSLRGIREAADAEDGVEEFRLRFRGPAGSSTELAVDLEQLALVSDYDVIDAHGVHAGRLDRGGVARQGLALRVPGSAVLSLPPEPRLQAQPGDRLRFALAVVGADEAVSVSVRAEGRPGDAQQFLCAPGGGWSEHALSVAAGQGPLSLRFSASTAARADGARAAADAAAAGGAASRAVLLIGSVLLLRAAPAGGPPIVLYVEDTLRADHVGTGGYAPPTDPHLRAIAKQGTAFTHAWAPSAWTRPSVSTLLTGLDPVSHGNEVHTRRVPASLTTLAEALAAEGWLTASFVTNYHAGAWSGLDQGFDVQGEPRAFGASDAASTLTSSLIRDPLARFLEEHADEQVFVFAHSLDPHAPYAPDSDDVLTLLRDQAPRATAPYGDRARYDEATLNYDAEVLHNDHALAALDGTLEALDLAQRTLFVFTSDHGEAFGEHGQWEHRKSLHEEELRVPWIVRWPGRVAAGTRVAQPVSLLDLPRTLFGLLGLAAPAAWQGRDLSALCTVEPAGPDARPAPIFAAVTYDTPPRAGVLREVAVIAWPFKLICSVTAPARVTPAALYRLDTDPHERASLLDDPAVREQQAALVAAAEAHLTRGPLFSGEGTDAAGMDPALREWMVQLGYLR